MENNQIGVICIVENKVGIEIFNNHSLYEKYDEMLLRSYIIDSSSSEKINISDKELENILASINEDSFRRWDAKFNEFLFLEKFMFVSYFLVIFHDYFIIDSF